jgi:hypothetical protein
MRTAMKKTSFCRFQHMTDDGRRDAVRALLGQIPMLTGRFKWSMPPPWQETRTVLTLELHDPYYWQSGVLAERPFREMVEGINELRFCLRGYLWKKRFFCHEPQYKHAVALGHHAEGRFSTKVDDGDINPWHPPHLTEQGRRIFADLGLDDYRLGHEWVQIQRSPATSTQLATKRWVNMTYALFKDFDQYALAKLRF